MLVSMTSRRGIMVCRPVWAFDFHYGVTKTRTLIRRPPPFAGAGGFYNLVDSAGAEFVRALARGFFSDELEHFRLGWGHPNIVANTKEHGFGIAAFLNDERAALV